MKQMKEDKENPESARNREQHYQNLRDKAATKKFVQGRAPTVAEKAFLKNIKTEMLLGPIVSLPNKDK